jgi:hypothetical protein
MVYIVVHLTSNLCDTNDDPTMVPSNYGFFHMLSRAANKDLGCEYDRRSLPHVSGHEVVCRASVRSRQDLHPPKFEPSGSQLYPKQERDLPSRADRTKRAGHVVAIDMSFPYHPRPRGLHQFCYYSAAFDIIRMDIAILT